MKNRIISGVVVELKTASCIVITPDGGFEEVRLPGNEVRLGDEISSTVVPAKGARYGIVRTLAAAAALLVIFLTGYSLTDGLQPKAVAYVSLDINPSIELGIDGQSRIIFEKGLNEDGKKLLLNIHIRKLPLSQGLSLIVEEAIYQGYIKEGQENLILSTLVYSDERTGDETAAIKQVVKTESVEEAIEKPLIANSLESRVVVQEVRPEIRQKANEAGVSQGKMLFREKAKDNHVNVEIEELKRENLRQLEKSKNIRLENLFSGDDKKKLHFKDKEKEDKEKEDKEKEDNEKEVKLPDQGPPVLPQVKTPVLQDRDDEVKRVREDNRRDSVDDKKAPGNSQKGNDDEKEKPGAVSVFPDKNKQDKPGNGKNSGTSQKKQPNKDNGDEKKTGKKSFREKEKSYVDNILKNIFRQRGIINEG